MYSSINCNFGGAGARQCATEEREERKPGEKRNVFSVELNTVTESLLTTVIGSEFQKAGAEHRKARFPKVVVADG